MGGSGWQNGKEGKAKRALRRGGFVAVLLVPPREARYRPIASYGAIGDGRSVALVSRHGSVDWWCPGRFDAPSAFGAILDAEVGGRFSLAPLEEADMRFAYAPDTNVLETEHATSHGRVRVVDFLAFAEDAGVTDSVLVRRVLGLEGQVEMRVEFEPRFQYGRVAARFAHAPGGLLARGAGEIMLLTGVPMVRRRQGARESVFRVREGEAIDVVLRHRPFDTPVPFAEPLAAPPADLEARTRGRWREWSSRTRFDGPDAPLVRRSALVLKMLQYERNGAFVAAPTASLPEAIGGVRNWDYRFTWLRDGALTARALHDLGHSREADAFAAWVRVTLGDEPEHHSIMYTVGGSNELPERELPHLEGYRGSRPVRIGNGAAHQRQLDVVGELLDFLHACRASSADTSSWLVFERIADWVVDHWREPDSGIWEMRSQPRHFVLSKAMAWAALDRASRVAVEAGVEAPVARWREEAERIREEVLRLGWSDERRAFIQAYDHPEMDASNLLLPLIGFLDARDPRMLATADRILEELTVDGLVYRYLGSDDGVPGGEATFAYCTFWLVEVLALQGRVREARALFDRLTARASELGLFAEEIDAATGEHLGNYPQAFPHVGLIQAARALHAAEHGHEPSQGF